jgi:hypothetical protein
MKVYSSVLDILFFMNDHPTLEEWTKKEKRKQVMHKNNRRIKCNILLLFTGKVNMRDRFDILSLFSGPKLYMFIRFQFFLL